MSIDCKSTDEWWKVESCYPKHAAYKVGETEVLIGPSPFTVGFTEEKFREIDGWISVNDQIPNFPQGTLYQWFPWPINAKPSNEMIFAFVQTLDYWIRTLKLKRVYIHCLHGGQRAPTMFAFYLWAKHRADFEQLVLPCEVQNMPEGKAMPKQYFWSYIDSYPDIKSFLDSLSKIDTKTYLDSVKITIKNRLLDVLKQVILYLRMVYGSYKYIFLSRVAQIWNRYFSRDRKRPRVYVFKEWTVDVIHTGRVIRIEDQFVIAFSFRGQYEIKIPLDNYMGPNPPQLNEEVEIIFLRHKVDKYWSLTIKINPLSNEANTTD